MNIKIRALTNSLNTIFPFKKNTRALKTSKTTVAGVIFTYLVHSTRVVCLSAAKSKIEQAMIFM